MHGLVEYDDDSDSDTHEKSLNARPNTSSEPRRAGNKSQVIIKKPITAHKGHTRTHEPAKPTQVEPGPINDDEEDMSIDEEEPQDELARIRAALRPPPIPGVEDWGIPPESTDPPDPALLAKLTQFQTLKKNPDNPRHFNDTLMSNRSFRNPHLYTKLVEFVDVDERTTNFPKHIWDPDAVQEEWFADKIAATQRMRYEQQASAQSSGKRTQINFTSSSKQDKEKGAGTTAAGSALGRKSRFQPYGSEAMHGLSSSSNNRGGYTRWG